jgi:4-alpha-glucanotransferase
MSQERMSGALLHPSSLPGPGGIGAFGQYARQFVDFLHNAGQRLWQVLPLGPTGYGNSPYSCYSAFAGNPLFIDLNEIVKLGDLDIGELDETTQSDQVDFKCVTEYKMKMLRLAATRFFSEGDMSRKRDFWEFCDSTFWLHDYALFMSCKDHFRGKAWNRWPLELVARNNDACSRYADKLGFSVGMEKYMQWMFFRQWSLLKQYANSQNIRIIGDAPIFVAFDSSDVWCNQNLFCLDNTRNPIVVAGVPPDYFSKTGQRWGNPLYDWKKHAEQGYAWWLARIANDLKMYDIVRLDHFRGFESYWEIPVKEKTAIKGKWVNGPGASLFEALKNIYPILPLIAEDLGVITSEVENLRNSFALPGMKILQFAFDSGATNPYLPHNYLINNVVYTGTHDNNTTLGWFLGLKDVQKRSVCDYLRCKPSDVVTEMMRAALSSVAKYSIIPVQDILNLNSAARMNTPGIASGNWGWRLKEGALSDGQGAYLRDLTELYNR